MQQSHDRGRVGIANIIVDPVAGGSVAVCGVGVELCGDFWGGDGENDRMSRGGRTRRRWRCYTLTQQQRLGLGGSGVCIVFCAKSHQLELFFLLYLSLSVALRFFFFLLNFFCFLNSSRLVTLPLDQRQTVVRGETVCVSVIPKEGFSLFLLLVGDGVVYV